MNFYLNWHRNCTWSKLKVCFLLSKYQSSMTMCSFYASWDRSLVHKTSFVRTEVLLTVHTLLSIKNLVVQMKCILNQFYCEIVKKKDLSWFKGMPMPIEEALMGKEFEHWRAKVFYSKRRSIIIELLNRLRTSIRGLPYLLESLKNLTLSS